MNRYFRASIAVSLWVIFGALATMAAVNVKIPAGTSVQVRIDENLSSETANVGQIFHGSLAAKVVANGRTLFPRGAIVIGEVVSVERSGRLSRPGELELGLRTIRTGGRTYSVSVQTLLIKGDSHTKSNVTKIGGGTAMGALIGAIAGGGKGAAIGAGVGAAAGTGVAAGTGKKPAEVQAETVLAWLAQGAPAVASTPEQDSRQYRSEPVAEAEEHNDNRRYSRDDDRDEGYEGSGTQRLFRSRSANHLRLFCERPRRPAAGPGEKGSFTSRAGTATTTQRDPSPRIAEAGATFARFVCRSPASIAQGLVTSGAERSHHSARPGTKNCGFVLVRPRLAGKTLV